LLFPDRSSPGAPRPPCHCDSEESGVAISGPEADLPASGG
jgi:hypothetical protein